MAVLTAALLSSPILQAQAKPAAPAAAGRTDLTLDVSQNCPVNLSARRWGQGGAVEDVRKGQKDEETPTLLLHFDPTALRRTVVSATVIVEGFGNLLHMDPADSPSTRTQTLRLTNAGKEGKGNWKLEPDQVPFANQIDIAEMQFSDGTSWKEARAAHCYVAVNGFTLVAATRIQPR